VIKIAAPATGDGQCFSTPGLHGLLNGYAAVSQKIMAIDHAYWVNESLHDGALTTACDA
jgi:hypothetical protein